MEKETRQTSMNITFFVSSNSCLLSPKNFQRQKNFSEKLCSCLGFLKNAVFKKYPFAFILQYYLVLFFWHLCSMSSADAVLHHHHFVTLLDVLFVRKEHLLFSSRKQEAKKQSTESSENLIHLWLCEPVNDLIKMWLGSMHSWCWWCYLSPRRAEK